MSFGNSPFGTPLDNAMFSIVPIFIMLGFVLVFGMILIGIFKGIRTWNYNNSQPVLSVIAKVITKRSDTSSSMHDAGDNIHHHQTHTTYYVTFEVESGDRMEFQVDDSEYGMLVEEDFGKLKFQGTRYLGFVRGKQMSQSVD